jgi:hypothetical protein
MIFNNNKDIESDIKYRISNYISDPNNDGNVKDLTSMIRTYLHEMKVFKEIESFKVVDINSNKFDIIFTKDENTYRFSVSLDLELRNLKIKKIISNKILD